MDTLDGIKKTNRRDRFNLYIYKCPQLHILKRHRLRDGRIQFFCERCGHYYTENSKKNHINKNPDFFDAFIYDYIKCVLNNKNPSISELCRKHNLSRASTYRHLFEKDKKLIIDTYVNLCIWAKQNLNGLYKREIIDLALILTHRSRSSNVRLSLMAEIDLSLNKTVTIKGRFSQGNINEVPNVSGIRFDDNGQSFTITINTQESLQPTLLLFLKRELYRYESVSIAELKQSLTSWI